MSVLLYRRPSYVERPSGPLNKSDCQRYVERTKGGKSTIPDNLSFENVINGSSLPPCTLSDFMDYMVYVAHDAENLQFYLWLRDYTARFNALRPEERALSPEWQVKDDAFAAANEKDRKTTRKSAESGNLLSELASSGAVADKRCSTPGPEALNAVAASMGFENPPTAKDATTSDFESFIARSVNSQKTATQITEDVNTAVGLKWQGCTYLIANSLLLPLLTRPACSLHSAFPQRNYQSHYSLHCSWFAPRAQLVAQGPNRGSPCPPAHHPPISVHSHR